ncbi:hypothetical protein [Undibacterium sp. TC9W]|uniref:hypothetical protein n=1 Tax=Undibacterium sp. TC9W TaxID=3413053 RepID=UPI003BF07A6A
MFLNFNLSANFDPGKFKLVYQLERYLQEHPDDMRDVQLLTLNDEKPYAGLKGVQGLYGSDEWWTNIRNGVIPSEQVTAQISDIFAVGFPGDNNPATELQLLLTDGSYKLLTMKANDPKDFKLFKIGCQIMTFHAFNELKNPSSYFGKPYPILIEIAVSVD